MRILFYTVLFFGIIITGLFLLILQANKDITDEVTFKEDTDGEEPK